MGEIVNRMRKVCSWCRGCNTDGVRLYELSLACETDAVGHCKSGNRWTREALIWTVMLAATLCLCVLLWILRGIFQKGKIIFMEKTRHSNVWGDHSLWGQNIFGLAFFFTPVLCLIQDYVLERHRTRPKRNRNKFVRSTPCSRQIIYLFPQFKAMTF